MARSFSQEPRSDSHKIGEMRYRMSHLPSTIAIARTLLLAGILLAVTVLAARTFLPAFALEDETIMYAENSTDSVAVYSATDQDDGDKLDWSIEVTGHDGEAIVDTDNDGQAGPILTITDGVLTFISPPDYESPWVQTTSASLEDLNTYTVIVTVEDDDTTDQMMDTTTVTIKVTNVDESGTVELSTLQPLEGIPFIASLTDPDGQVPVGEDVVYPVVQAIESQTHATTSWQWARSMDGQSGWVNITATTTDNEMIDINSRTPEAADIDHYLRATVTYRDGFGKERTASMVSSEPVLKNLENDAPVFQYTAADTDDLPVGAEVGDNIGETETLTRRLPENSAQGTAVGAPVVAYDEDDDVLTYELAATDAYQDFDIDRQTGQITLTDDSIDLDYDQNTPPTYTITVVATDPSDVPGNAATESRDTISVTIRVTNLDEAPSIAAENLTAGTGLTSKDHPEQVDPPNTQDPAYSANVATYTATDDEDDLAGTDLAWSLEGNDRDKLEFSADTGGTTILQFKDPQPDFDNPSDIGANRTYNVTVKVTDSNDMTDTRSVAITIINLDEEGVVTFSHVRPEAGTRLTASLDDPDKQRNVRWQWYSGDINTSATGTGATSATYTPTADDVTRGVLLAVASYTDGHGPDKDATGTTASVQADRGQDDPPEFTDDDGSGITINSLSETASPGDDVGTELQANDPDGDELIFRLGGTNASLFKLENRTTPQILVGDNTKFDYENKTSYSVRVTAIDPSGDDTAVTVTINLVNVEERPLFTGGDTEIIVNENTPITRVLETYTATDDEDRKRGRAVRFILDQDSEDIFAIGNTASNRGRLTFKNVPDFESPTAGVNSGTSEARNTYTIEITARDNGTDTNPAATLDSDPPLTVTVRVQNEDEPGTVTLSTLQPLQDIPVEATLTDPDGQANADGDTIFPINTDLTNHASTTWQWARSRDGRTGWVDIVATTTENEMIDIKSRTPEKADIDHFLRVTATYVDGFGSERTASVVSSEKVRRNLENDAPVFVHAEGNTYTDDQEAVQESPNVSIGVAIPDDLQLVRRVDENSQVGTSVGGPVTAYDEDDDILTYELDTTDGDHASFDLNTRSGQISVDTSDLDQETKDTYTITIIAKDPSDRSGSESRDTITVTIFINDVEDDPSITAGAAKVVVTENDVDVAALTSSVKLDDSEIGTDSTVDDTSGLLELATYTATDDDDRTEIPVKELIWTLSGSDSDDFDIATTTVGCSNITRDDCAILSFKGAPNYESPKDAGGDNTYNVTVVVTDSNGDTVTHDVVVTIENVEENGEVTLSHLQPEVDVAITAELEDPDGGITGETWQWYWSSDGNAPWNLIRGATSSTYTPVEDDATNFLQAVATYTDDMENPEDDTGTQEDESKDTMSGNSDGEVQIKPTTNETPQFPDQDPGTSGKQAERAIPENTASDPDTNPNPGNIGAPVVANEVDSGDVLNYTLGGRDEAAFEIDRATGQITVGEGTKLDHETKDTYVVTVTATDSSLASDMITVTIKVTDVNEMPEIMKRGLVVVGRQSVSYPENGTDAVETYSATGADAAGATWSLEGADANRFSISSGGVLTFNSSPNFEDAADQGGNNEYNVTVKATATSGGLSMSRNVTVTVTNVDEPGTINFTSLGGEVRVGVELTAELDEGDEETNVTWRWGRTAVDTDPCTEIPGETSNTYTPVEADVGNHLCAMVTYDDPLGAGKTLTFATEDTVEAASTTGTPGTLALSLSQPIIGESISATLTDADNPNTTTYSWEWERSTNNSSWSTVSGATGATYTVGTADAGNYLRATLTYTDNSGAGQTATAATTRQVPIDAVYDRDYDGTINGTEVLDAVADYFNRLIDGDRVLDVVALYFDGLN